MNHSISSIQHKEFETTNNILSHSFKPLGIYKNQAGNQFLVIQRLHSIHEEAINISTALLAHGRDSILSEYLIKNDVIEILDHPIKEVKKSLIHFLKISKNLNTILLDQEGFHEIETTEGIYSCFIKNANIHLHKQLPDGHQIILIENALKKIQSKNNIDLFNEKFHRILSLSPRLLVTLLFSLTSYFYKSFRISPLSLMLVGPTSIGKSIIQYFVGNIVKGNADVQTVNATTVGLHDYCSEQGTYSVNLEDAHGKKSADPIISLIMDVGNEARRLRSHLGSTTTKPAKNMRCTLIISAEKELKETAIEGNATLHGGVSSRIFSIHPGEYGMFDDLCGFNKSSDLADFIKEHSTMFAGVLGDLVVSSVAANLEEHKERFKKDEKIIKTKILKSVGIDEDLNGPNHRILNGLTFCAFVGRLTIKYCHLSINRNDIDNAIGILFKEHLTRSNNHNKKSQNSDTSIIKIIRNAIKNNMQKFRPFEQYILLKKPSVIGLHFQDELEDLYLIKPQKFKDLIGDRWDNKAFKQLAESGLIKTSKGRGHQYQKRFPNKQRINFIAISGSIMDE